MGSELPRTEIVGRLDRLLAAGFPEFLVSDHESKAGLVKASHVNIFRTDGSGDQSG